jgi:hypothetical protein
MKIRRWISLLAFAACGALLCRAAGGQAYAGRQVQTGWAQIGIGYRQMRSNNAAMSELQPSWMAPITASDARLGQGLRFSVSQQSWPGEHPIAYGNNHGLSLIAGRRLQFELVPPSYFRNHSVAHRDGWGNAAIEIKARIASGNANHGNYIVTGVLYHAFAPRGYQNGATTGLYKPAIAGGRMLGRVALLSSLGGYLPTGEITQQGRGIEWKGTAELRAGAHAWFDLEDSALFLRGGRHDGNVQNLISPGVFFLPKHGDRGPSHASVVLDCGMQLATSSFYFYNRNLITEVRLVF